MKRRKQAFPRFAVSALVLAPDNLGSLLTIASLRTNCRTPHGMRGLKYGHPSRHRYADPMEPQKSPHLCAETFAVQ